MNLKLDMSKKSRDITNKIISEEIQKWKIIGWWDVNKVYMSYGKIIELKRNIY